MQAYIDRFTDGTNLGEGTCSGLERLALVNPPKPGTSVVFSMYNVGAIVGPFFAGPCAYGPVSPSTTHIS